MSEQTAPRFQVVQGDITQSPCDSIMASCNPRRISSLQESVSQAAGAQWREALLRDKQVRQPGDAWVMSSGLLPYDHLYMCMTPIWDGNVWNEERLLIHCYKNILDIVDVRDVRCLAVPLLATGKHRFPDERAVRVAIQTCMDNSPAGLEDIHFTAIDPAIYAIAAERLEKELAV